MMYGSWDMERDRQTFLSSWTIFCPFKPITTRKSKFWKNEEKKGLRHHHFTQVYHNDNLMMYDSWDMNPNRQNFLSFWAIFFPFTPLTTQKIKMLKNRKKGPGDIIISHRCTKNHDNMLHCSWDVEHDRFNYFSFWAIFCPFTYLTALKIKIKKKMKKSLEISSFYTSVPKIMIIYAILFLRYDVWQI